MIGVIDVGGGMRDIFGAGVFDYCLEHDINFDRCYGVSAGCANIGSYLAKQKFRNYTFYTEYSRRKEYMSLSNLVKQRSFVDLDYVYNDLSNADGEYPLDYPVLAANPATFTIVATDAETGQATYFEKEDMAQDQYDPIKASSNVPVIDQPYPIGDHLYYDGGMSDPIPYQRALDDGCDKIVVILTRPSDYFRSADKDRPSAKLLEKWYPKAAAKLAARAYTYNEQLAAIHKLQEEGKALILAPDNIGGLKTLSTDVEQLKGLYRKGLVAGKKIAEFVK